MSEEDKTTAAPAVEAGKRPPVAIDLPKKDVREVVAAPVDDPAPAPAVTDAPAARTKVDPAKSYVDSRLEKTEAPPAPPPARTGRAGAIFGGALAGGVFGLLSAVGYATLNAPPAQTPDPRIAALDTTVAGIEKRLSSANPDIDRLSAALKAAEARIAAVDARPPAVPKAVQDRLESLDSALSTARDQAGDALRKIEGIEKLASAPPPEPAQSAPAPEAPRIDLAPIAARIVKVEEALAATDRKASGGAEAAAAIDARLKSAEQSVAALSKPRPSDSAAAILAVAAMARRGLEAGEPIASPLAALGALGVAPDILKPLSGFAEKPAPQIAALARQFVELAAALPKPQAPAPAAKPADMSITDRLKANVASLVEIRPAGAPAVPDAGGHLAAARAALQSGNLVAFTAAAGGLPEDQRTALRPVVEAVAARIAARQAITRIEASALDAAARRN